MNSPRTATANYVLQHLLTVHTDGLGAARPPELHQLSPAQANNHVPSALDSTLQLDALLVFHNALYWPKAPARSTLRPAATDYSYYSNLVSSLGGAVLRPAEARDGARFEGLILRIQDQLGIDSRTQLGSRAGPQKAVNHPIAR